MPRSLSWVRRFSSCLPMSILFLPSMYSCRVMVTSMISGTISVSLVPVTSMKGFSWTVFWAPRFIEAQPKRKMKSFFMGLNKMRVKIGIVNSSRRGKEVGFFVDHLLLTAKGAKEGAEGAKLGVRLRRE